jgi:hypothetical protein
MTETSYMLPPARDDARLFLIELGTGNGSVGLHFHGKLLRFQAENCFATAQISGGVQ